MNIEFGQHGPEIDVEETGRRIQQLRKERKLKVSDISDYMGFYEPQAVYKWLQGKCLPTLPNMARLSCLFGTTIDDIIRYAEVECRVEETGRLSETDKRTQVGRNTGAHRQEQSERNIENIRGEGERTSPLAIVA